MFAVLLIYLAGTKLRGNAAFEVAIIYQWNYLIGGEADVLGLRFGMGNVLPLMLFAYGIAQS